MGVLTKYVYSIRTLLFVGTMLRLGFLVYGIWQDKTMRVKYTDIDYHVFTDAARYVVLGESPYRRATYRYTPLLAWLLTPNIILHEAFGKILFILCDVLTGYMIYLLVRIQHTSEAVSAVCSAMWLLNPLPITVSSRGNAESILSLLILVSFYCLTRRSHIASFMGYLLYGLTVHMKIYPITYALPLYLMYREKTQIECLFHQAVYHLWPTPRRLALVLVSADTFFALTAMYYHIYGMEFLEETYFYHITRRDTRHNFSVYFYLLYLTEGNAYSHLLSLLMFLPQVTLLLISSFRYYDDLPFCCFLNTFIFVTFNKVCTSQYFLWYLCLLPLVVPQITMSVHRALALLISWFAGQALWLLPAYYFEFEGRDTFFYIWLASIFFFIVNINILCNIVYYYQSRRFPVYGVERSEKKLE